MKNIANTPPLTSIRTGNCIHVSVFKKAETKYALDCLMLKIHVQENSSSKKNLS